MSDQRKANAANSSNSSTSNNNKLEDPGVYMNCRLMHSFTSLIGATVEVELMGGERYEGIFKTFSPKCDLVLCSVAQIINDDESEKRSSALGSNVGNLVACLEKNIKIEDQVVFDQASLIKFRANNIDLDFATMPKKTVLTDGEISGVDGKKMQEKELVPWDDGGECDYNALEESSNGIQNGGWDSSEMFDYNERNYNINSTYNDDMSGYTIKLEQREDPDFVQRKIHAEKIAREIEKDPKRQSRLAKENDLDEETRFSAVVADRKGQRNGPNNAMPINNSNNNNSNNNSMTRGSPRNEMSHSGRDGRDGQRRESMRSNRGDPGRDSRERDFSRQNSRQGGSGGGGPSGGGGRGRDMDRRIDNRGVGGGGGGDVRNDGRNDGRIDGRNDGRNDGRGGDRGGDGRGDRGRGNDRRISGGINEANWRTDNRRSVNDRRKMDEPQLQPQQQQQQPKKADQRPSQTPPPPQTPGTPSSSISDAGTTKSDSSAFSKKDTSPKAGVTAASVVALSVAPQPNNSPSLVPQTTLTASDSPVSGAYSKKESSPMAGAAAPVALGGGGGGTNVPSSPAGAAPPSGAPPSAVTTPVSASSSSSSLPTPSSASSSQSTGSGEIKSNLNPNAKAFTPRANPSPAAMQQQYMLAASQQHQQQQQQQAQQQQQQQQAMVNFSYQSQHMVTSPPSTMPNQYIQISPHPSHLPPQSIHHHLPPHQQQGHPHQQPGHPHQQPGHPHQQQPHPHQHQAHPHQPQGQPHQQQGPHPQMGPGGPYMQFPPYNLPIPQMLPNGAQYITIPNVPTMPNAMPHGGLYTGPVPGVPTQAGPGQPTGPNPAGGPGGYPCNVFFHHNVSLPGPMPGIGGPKQ